MSSKKLLTIFGATGNQGGSVIDTVLAHPELKEKYSLRGITRDPASGKSKSLTDQGVEMVKAELNDLESLKTAFRGSHGVFGVTDFWAVLDKGIEIQQGKNLFEACKAEGVEHFVFSTLPHAEKLTGRVLKNVDHFDSKAEVAEFIEGNKGGMMVSYFMPAMFASAATSVRVIEGQPTLSMPFPSENIPWPLIAPRRDGGKWVMGLFEGGKDADGVKAHAVSTWTTPKEVVAALSKESGKEVVFKSVSEQDIVNAFVPKTGETVAKELAETFRLIGEYSYYGIGEEKNQKEHNKWLVKGAEPASFPQWAKENGPWKFE